MRYFSKIIYLFIIAVLISGCAGNPYILRRRQKTLELEKNKGMVLFTVKAKNTSSYRLTLYNYSIQEVNQYKFYEKLKPITIPLSQENYYPPEDLFLLSLILPEGAYKLAFFYGMLTSFFGYQYYLICNKIVDVSEGFINYAGKLNFEISSPNAGSSSIIGIEDAYNNDVKILKNNFPILQDWKIRKDLFY